MSLSTLQATYLKNYMVPEFLIDTVHLDFDIQNDFTRVKSVLNIYRNPKSSAKNSPFILNGEALILEAMMLDGKKLSEKEYDVNDTHLIIKTIPEKFLLETCVKIFPKKNTALMGLYQSRNNMCTQCEAEGFRRITYFLDRPDVMTHFTVTITADKKQYPYLLSNGNFIEEKNLDGNRHCVKWQDPSKKPCYLFALVAGDFDLIQDQFITMSKRRVDLHLYLEKGFRDQGDYAMIALKKSMKWDEEKFGRAYDLDRFMTVAVSDFNMGAMENKGLNIFNTKYILAKPQTATDGDYINIERVVAHEYFHNWSGNRITCRDWFQLTLKEGLTVCRDQHFTEDTTSAGVARIDVVNTLRNHQFPEDAGPMAHSIRPDSYMKIDNFYTATIYEKGAEVIRMVRTFITPIIFRKAMDYYFSHYDGQAVTTEDFLHAMQEISGKDFTQFSRWYHQAGTPVLRVKTHYDAEKKTYDVIIKQSCSPTPGQENKLPLHMPFAMGLIDKNCEDMHLQLQGEKNSVKGTKILEIKKPEETFTFINVVEKPAPSLLRHFSAPVELQYAYSLEELALLLQCDSDAFCRFEAGQRLMVRVIEAVANEIAVGKKPATNVILIESIKKLLLSQKDDLNLLSRLISFPSLRYLLTHMPQIDLEIIFAAKTLIEKTVASELDSEWEKLFSHHQLSKIYTYNNTDCGHRRVKNMALYYLLKIEKEKYFVVAFEQFMQANNMTDQLGALGALNDHAVIQREKALAHFYEIYKHEPLVVNKWLAMQASSTLPTLIPDVKKLLHHSAFDMNNPNSVYSLLVTLGQNTVRFHNKNGDGYQLLAEKVLDIDAKNPQVAARVIQPLTQWKQMDATRGALMKAQLHHLSSQKLSGNLFEIVSKSLAT